MAWPESAREFPDGINPHSRVNARTLDYWCGIMEFLGCMDAATSLDLGTHGNPSNASRRDEQSWMLPIQGYATSPSSDPAYVCVYTKHRPWHTRLPWTTCVFSPMPVCKRAGRSSPLCVKLGSPMRAFLDILRLPFRAPALHTSDLEKSGDLLATPDLL